jgi:ParB-like chromosome segregation protein Spo0J
MIESVNIKLIIAHPNNPRIIKDDKFKRLVKSIQEFPEMLELRPIVVDDNYVVLGGNMRLRACKEAGLTRVPIIKASALTAEQQKRFIIADNVGFGEWDWDTLANEWDPNQLVEWGLDVPIFDPETNDQDEPVKNESYIIEVKCDDEDSRQAIYNKMIELGFNCYLKK